MIIQDKTIKETLEEIAETYKSAKKDREKCKTNFRAEQFLVGLNLSAYHRESLMNWYNNQKRRLTNG